MAEYSDNLGSVLDALHDELPDGSHEVTWFNVMEYAHALHDRDGYFIFNPDHAVKTVRENLEAAADEDGRLDEEAIQLALEKAGFEEINWLLEKAGGTQPPVRAGEGARQARQGGWSDITGMLAASYKFQVNGEMVGESADLVPPPDNEPDRPPPLSI